MHRDRACAGNRTGWGTSAPGREARFPNLATLMRVRLPSGTQSARAALACPTCRRNRFPRPVIPLSQWQADDTNISIHDQDGDVLAGGALGDSNP